MTHRRTPGRSPVPLGAASFAGLLAALLAQGTASPGCVPGADGCVADDDCPLDAECRAGECVPLEGGGEGEGEGEPAEGEGEGEGEPAEGEGVKGVCIEM